MCTGRQRRRRCGERAQLGKGGMMTERHDKHAGTSSQQQTHVPGRRSSSSTSSTSSSSSPVCRASSVSRQRRSTCSADASAASCRSVTPQACRSSSSCSISSTLPRACAGCCSSGTPGADCDTAGSCCVLSGPCVQAPTSPGCATGRPGGTARSCSRAWMHASPPPAACAVASCAAATASEMAPSRALLSGAASTACSSAATILERARSEAASALRPDSARKLCGWRRAACSAFSSRAPRSPVRTRPCSSAPQGRGCGLQKRPKKVSSRAGLGAAPSGGLAPRSARALHAAGSTNMHEWGRGETGRCWAGKSRAASQPANQAHPFTIMPTAPPLQAASGPLT